MYSAVQTPVAAAATSVFASRAYGVAVFVAALATFLVACITNDKFASLMSAAYPWLPGRLRAPPSGQMANLINYGLTATKNLVFTLGVAALAAPVAVCLHENWREILNRRRVLAALAAFALFLVFVTTVVPVSLGLDYAKASSSPFTQPTNWLYRRILLPYLANLFRVDGVFYILFFWMVTFGAFLVVLFWLGRKRVELGWVEMTSFLSVGMFFCNFTFPGYPEVLCLFLAIVALIRFEQTGTFTIEQVAYFVLALLTHEAAALVIFGPIALCIFGWRSYAPFAAILAMYVLAWLLNYGFGFATAYNTQNVVGQEPAWRYFLDRIALFPLAIVWTYKLYFAAIPLGIWTYWKAGRLNLVCYILVAFGLSVAVCSIATDTTRMVSLSTLAVIAGALPWLPRMSERQRRGLAWANLLIPTLYSTSNSTGVFVVRGIYGLVLSQLPNVTVAAGWH